MPQPKKLIEVAMPVKEISAESVRDKSIRHGHISTLHLWWARRPLPVCRAVVFASLVPDPLDENCPQAFKDAVSLLLCKANNPGDPYKPYDDIPYTSAIDPMEDNLRNRLLMFIGKFSETYIQNEKAGKTTSAKDQLSHTSLIKWESRNNDAIIGKARKLIWVAHNAGKFLSLDLGEGQGGGRTAVELISSFDQHYKAIKDAENDLYSTPDRNITTPEVKHKEEKLHQAIEAFLDHMPKVFDPFAGGGAIPLEAARLGCRSYGNDLNPVAHIIQKGSVEFPQKYGKPITYTKEEFIKRYGNETFKQWCADNHTHKDAPGLKIQIPNRLAFDVDYYARKLLAMAEKEIGHYYPASPDGKKPVAYYWARVATCSNPSCKAEVPMLKQFYLCNKKDKQVYLNPILNGKNISFEIKKGKTDIEGWMSSNSLNCPCCGNQTSIEKIKQQSQQSELKEKMLAVIVEDDKGKGYRRPNETELISSEIDISLIDQSSIPAEKMLDIPDLVSGRGWGIKYWRQLFSPRQLLAIQTFVKSFHILRNDSRIYDSNYEKVVLTYLGLWIDRIIAVSTTFGIWHTGRETLERPMGRQAIPMVFDYPESIPFALSSGAGLNQLEWITRFIDSENDSPFYAFSNNTASGDIKQFAPKDLNATVTDPPYYDAIAYGDLSDFFYVWMKKTLTDLYPYNFSTPQTPKSEECTALKHHHNEDFDLAKHHFEKMLLKIFNVIERQTEGLVTIMFAHQSTEAWTTLCRSILGAGMNITGSWASETEMIGALKTDKAFLASSVTVSCVPSIKFGIANYKTLIREVESKVNEKVDYLYRLGFRGSDLLTACFGQAVSVFGQYEKVEKADGTEVTVAELLELARDSAFNALVKGFQGDEYTKFYIGWLQLNGFTEAEHDDVMRISQIGLNVDVNNLVAENILIRKGNKESLATFSERVQSGKKLSSDGILINQVHYAMELFKSGDRKTLIEYINQVADNPESIFWRVLTSLCELLPSGSDDHKQANGLLANKESLLRESRQIKEQESSQTKMDF
ncbi:MAG: DUF1156 domain-containing protein [Bacteroidales bacterium]|nr:DUF1156 domain-containing protein [Bacteroidales bacterium]